MRLIVAKAERVFLARQQVLIHRLCSPTWAYVIANAIAKFSTTRDESSGKLPDMEQVRTFASTLRDLSGVPIPLDEEFTSPQDRQLIAKARAKKYSDTQIRQLLNSKKQP